MEASKPRPGTGFIVAASADRFTRMLAGRDCEVHWAKGDCTNNGEARDLWCWPCRAREVLGLPATRGFAERARK